MTQGEHGLFSEASVKLEFEPSQKLGDTLRLFLNDEHKLDSHDELSIRSLGGFSVSFFGESHLMRPFPCHEEQHGEPNIESKIREFENKTLHEVVGQTVPLAAFVTREQIPQSATNLTFRILPSPDQKLVFEKFMQITKNYVEAHSHQNTEPKDPAEYVVYRIHRMHLNLAKSAFELAVAELDSVLKPADKAAHVSEYKRSHTSMHDEDIYVSFKPKLSISRIPKLIVNNDNQEPSIA